MSNLLEKASILLTPTAYDDGKILSVKPEEVLGEELVVNGDFSDGSTSWNFGPGWSIVNENASHTGSGSYIEQGSLTQGVSYKVVINVTQASGSGFPQIYMGGLTTAMTSVGVYTFNIVAVANDKIKIRGLNDCEISSVSVKQEIDGDFDFTRNSSATRVNSQGLIEDVQILSSNLVSNGDFSQEGSELVINGSFDTDSNWTLTNGATINDSSLNIDYNLGNGSTTQTNVFTIGKTYKVQVNVDNNSTGVARIGSGLPATTLTNGLNTFYLEAVGTDIEIRNHVNFIGSIDNVSVKEVGQGWTLGTGVTIGEDRAIFTSTASGQSVSQNAVASSLTNGALAKVSFEVLSRTQGSFGVYFSGTLVGTLASAGVFTGYFTKGTETSFYIRALGTTSGSISNISVVEITDDTNLPRINYEGFSYQDSLGSEEVVNGDFSEGSANWFLTSGASVENGQLTLSASANVYQNPSLTIGKKYRVKYEITSIDAGSSGITFYGGSSAGTMRTEAGIYTEDIIQSGSGLLFFFTGGGFVSGSIDNVSVKEVLGQEVVPDSGCGSWLFEPQSTNLIPYSEDFTQWNKSNASLINTISSTVVSPDGVSYANKLYPIGSSTSSFIIQGGSGNCFSVFVKKGERRWVLIYGGFNNSNVWFDSENGVFGNIFDNVATVESFGNDWYKIKILWAQNSSHIRIYNTDSGTSTQSTGNGTDGLYIWGAQLEVQSYSTSYITTSGSTVTRLARCSIWSW